MFLESFNLLLLDEKEALAAQNAELSAKIASNEDQLQVNINWCCVVMIRPT